MNLHARILTALLAALLLAACGKSNGSSSASGAGITGTYAYADAEGSFSITFSPDGTALLDLDKGGNHATPAVKYSIEDGKIVLHSPTGKGDDMVLTRNRDGSLQGPWVAQPLKPQH